MYLVKCLLKKTSENIQYNMNIYNSSLVWASAGYLKTYIFCTIFSKYVEYKAYELKLSSIKSNRND